MKKSGDGKKNGQLLVRYSVRENTRVHSYQVQMCVAAWANAAPRLHLLRGGEMTSFKYRETYIFSSPLF